ncbi:hypothetical protein ACFLTS_06845 [Chloroflexota bacterium]
MPNYHSFLYENIKVEVKPRGIRRYWLLRKIPYFTGSEVVANIIIKTTSGEPNDWLFYIDVWEPDDNDLIDRITLPEDNKPCSEIEYELKSPPISISGDQQGKANFDKK